jgi:hypothetical protein
LKIDSKSTKYFEREIWGLRKNQFQKKSDKNYIVSHFQQQTHRKKSGTVLHFAQIANMLLRVARFILVQHTKTGKIYQITIKYTQCPQNIPNGSKIDLMVIKYTNISHCKTLQNLPKLEKYAIWQPWCCYLLPRLRFPILEIQWIRCLPGANQKPRRRTGAIVRDPDDLRICLVSRWFADLF